MAVNGTNGHRAAIVETVLEPYSLILPTFQITAHSHGQEA